MTQLIGLSGGIGSGKSTVTRMLADLGATTICADALVHELQAPKSPMLAEISRVFGASVIDEQGALDRPALGAIVFRDADARKRLGSIVHGPVIGEMMNRAKAALDAGASMVVLDIPLLFEGAKTGTGSSAVMNFDATVTVWVPVAIQIERTIARDDCDRSEAERRIAAQLSIDEKRDMADHVIDNSQSIESTKKQVDELYDLIVGGS